MVLYCYAGLFVKLTLKIQSGFWGWQCCYASDVGFMYMYVIMSDDAPTHPPTCMLDFCDCCHLLHAEKEQIPKMLQRSPRTTKVPVHIT